jgi:hypothetical protein
MRIGFSPFACHRRLIRFAHLSVLLAILTSSTAGPTFSKQASAEVSSTKGPIPKNFKTWSIFLVCNPKWLDTAAKGDQPTDLFQLYRQFQSFGRTIGDDNVAVWFWKSTTFQIQTTSLVKNVDVERSVRFCKAWRLAPSTTPTVVVTSTYPDEANLGIGRPGNSAVYELGNMKPQDISTLLGKLADKLLLGNSSTPVSSSDTNPQLWVRLLQATQALLNEFGCKWTFNIDAGPVKADLRPCHDH